MSTRILDAASGLRRRGFWPVPLLGKRPLPSLKQWQDLRIDPQAQPHLFNGSCTGVGIHLGASGLVDLEADCRAAEYLLDRLAPDTGCVWEHNGRRHRLYRCADAKHRGWDAPPGLVPPGGKASLVELRCGNHQSAVPPSVHPDTQREYRWVADGEPSRAGADALLRVGALASVAGVAALRWDSTSRHGAALALAGALRRRGVTEEEALAILEAVCEDTRDGETDNRLEAVRDTYARGDAEPLQGLPSLANLLGAEAAGSIDRVLKDAGMLAERPAPEPGPARPREVPWPEPPGEAAFHGLAGDFVRLVGPHTEADPVSLLSQFLVAFGSAVGRGRHARVEADLHHTNEYAVLVGDTAKGRKGTSWGHVRRLFAGIDPEWAEGRIQAGLSSGEGLTWAVRDPITKTKPVRDKGRTVEYEEVIEDKGVEDKRLLVIEEEFASVLKAASRDGNTLSAVVRTAWNTGNLRSLTKNSPAVATGAHISIIGHITKDELRRYLDSTEAANGFANRILWVAVRRSRILPEGGRVPEDAFADLGRRVAEAVAFARTVGEVRRDDAARELWHKVYPDLSDGRPGLVGAVTSRSEAHVMRLSVLYALLDRSNVVREQHLLAALEFWGYCDASARYVFGDAVGDPVADAILRRLEQSPEGVTRTEIRDLFQRHQTSARIDQALRLLQDQGLARMEAVPTDGRPEERWFRT